MIDLNAVRHSACSHLPMHAAIAGRQHRALTFVKQEGQNQCQKIEVQNKVLWSAAREVMKTCNRLHGEHRSRMHPLQNFQLGGPGKLTGPDDPWHTQPENGGSADFTKMTVISCATPRWFSPVSQLLTQLTLNMMQKEIGKNTEVICYVSDLDDTDPEWKITEVRALGTVATALHGCSTLGVAVGPRRCIADQLLAKAAVIRAMHERVQPCQDPQTEFALIRESIGELASARTHDSGRGNTSQNFR